MCRQVGECSGREAMYYSLAVAMVVGDCALPIRSPNHHFAFASTATFIHHASSSMEEVPFEDRHVPLAEIDWDRSAWWWYPLTRAIQPAIRMLSLGLSLIAVMVAGAGISLGQWLFAPRWDSSAFEAMASFKGFESYRNGLVGSPVLGWLVALPEVFFSFESFGLSELAFCLFVWLWLFTAAALFGAVIARRAAVELGQRTVATWSESFQIVGSRWQSYFWATGMHIVGVSLLLIPFALLGLLSRLGTPGAVVAGVLLLLAFPLVFGIGRFALSAIVCFPLSVCAISVEKKADAFEGFSRSNAYFFQRPAVGALCVLVLMLIGVIGEQIVYWTLNLGWGLTRTTFNAAGDSSADLFVGLGNELTIGLIGAYWFSFFWSASAAVYLILRRSVDNCELDEMETIESDIELSLPNIPTASQPANRSDLSETTPPQANADHTNPDQNNSDRNNPDQNNSDQANAGADDPQNQT